MNAPKGSPDFTRHALSHVLASRSMLLEVDVAAQGAHERRSRVVALWSALLCHRAQGFCVSAYVHLARLFVVRVIETTGPVS